MTKNNDWFYFNRVAVGFINGAYDGGVYSTKSIKFEDCGNKVKFTLMDYVINLLHDTKEVIVSEENVNAFLVFMN